MVSGAKMEGGTQVMSAWVRNTVQSIKEIVKNHSEAEIYAALKESNMDPNETTQKLLNQDPFREVKSRRDRRKEIAAQKVSNDQRKHSENARPLEKSTPQMNTAPGGGSARSSVNSASYGRRPLPGSSNGPISKAFRVVRDNRVNNNSNAESKTDSLHHQASSSDEITPCTNERGLAGNSTNQNSGGQDHSQVSNSPSSSSKNRQASRLITDGMSVKEGSENSAKLPQVQVVEPVSPQSHSTAFVGSSNSVVGLYSSSMDPVHVPSPDSRAPSAVGAIKREVGVVGVRRLSSEDSVKCSSASGASSNPQLRREYSPSESFRSLPSISKTDQLSQPAATQSMGSTISGSRSMSQYGGKPNQHAMGHHRGIKEWKPKSNQKTGVVSPGVIEAPPKSSESCDENTKGTDYEVPKLQDRLSQVNIHETQNVIIAQDIRVPDTDRCQLTFGSFGMEYESSRNSVPGGVREELNGESAAGLSVSDPILGDNVSLTKSVDSTDEPVRNSRSGSPASSASSENQLSEKKESNSQSLDGYGDIGRVREDIRFYAPSETHQLQGSSEIASFTVSSGQQGYDPQAGYDLPYFRTTVEEAVHGQSLQPPQEALNSHAANSIQSSSLPLEQQQQHQQHPQAMATQMQVHMPHFTNLMPYRQFLSPVYVPPMAMPGYSSNPAYSPHPSNGNSYMFMPGAAASHLSVGGLKYGIHQYKPIPAGNPAGFGNFAGPSPYSVNVPGGMVGNASGMDDSSRMKYKDGNMYVSNPQLAEASEIWIPNPRDIPGQQSAPYYNLTGQVPHAAAYMPSHAGHASFNGAVTQSSHMQFPAIYHPQPQATGMANPHHLGPAMGGNVGVGVGATGPVAQVGAYQQPQLGQFNWLTNY